MVFTKQYSDELSVNESEKRIMFPINLMGWRIRGRKEGWQMPNALKHFETISQTQNAASFPHPYTL